METIGARLKQAREERHLTLQQASDSTKVRIHYLQALETDDLSAMPSSAQARGFLRLYAEFLGINLADASKSLSSHEVGAPTVSEPIAPAPIVPPSLSSQEMGAPTISEPIAPAPVVPPSDANIEVPVSPSPSKETSEKNLGLRLLDALRKLFARKGNKEPDTLQPGEAEIAQPGGEIEAIPFPDNKNELENKSEANPVSGDSSTDDSVIVKKNLDL